MQSKGVDEMAKIIGNNNAEEGLEYVVGLIKENVAIDSRTKAFEDCTNFWNERIHLIISDKKLEDHEKLKEISKELRVHSKK